MRAAASSRCFRRFQRGDEFLECPSPLLVVRELVEGRTRGGQHDGRPGDRKIALTMITLLFMFGAILTIIGSFFRGPGYNWTWPWAQGVFFEL